MNIVDTFEELGIGLRSMTETFDSSHPMGRFAIQMIASVAELERGMIIERTSMGRERIARLGRWTGGVVPYGYALDHNGHLAPEGTPRNGAAYSEVDIVRRIFQELVEGGSAVSIARRLNTEGIPFWSKYQKRGQERPSYVQKANPRWIVTSITGMVRSPTYKGVHIWNRDTVHPVEREVPALVDSDTWERAQKRLTENRRLSKRQNDHNYLLRSLIRCCSCGSSYQGSRVVKKNWERHYYRCGSQSGYGRVSSGLCNAKHLHANQIEEIVWEDIRSFIENPGDVLDKLQERMQADLEQAPDAEARKRELQRAVVAKAGERDRLLNAYRRGVIDIEALEEQVTRSHEELEPLQEELLRIAEHQAHAGRHVGQITNAQTLLNKLRDQVATITKPSEKRPIVEALVQSIEVATKGEGHHKSATVHITYRFEDRSAVDYSTIGCRQPADG